MAVEVEVIEGWGKDAGVKRKWMKTWEKLGERILKLPKWMQDLVLDDVNTAIKNRVATMEMINNARRRS